MKPFQIGLLVLVGALGGALIMKFSQRPKAAPVAMATAPAQVQAPPVSATIPDEPVEPKPAEPQPVEPKPAQLPRKTATAAETAKAAPVVPMRHHTQPIRRAAAAPVRIAQSLPPARPEKVAPPADPSTPQGAATVPAATPAISPEPAAAPNPSTEPTPETSADPPVPQPAEPPVPQSPPSVTLQAGMTLPVSLGESLSSEHNLAGDTFTATLTAPLSAGGFVIAERGARVEGHVIEAQKASHAKGKATLALELTSVNTSDGQRVGIRTEILRKQGSSMATQDQVGVVAAAAGIGAIIGAMAGGGKGAAIGAGAGGAAGGGGVMATRDKPVTLPTESKITFRLSAPVTVTEQVNK